MSYTNDCGFTGTYSFFIEVTQSSLKSTIEEPLISIVPNPTSNFVNVEIKDNNTDAHKLKKDGTGNTFIDLVDLNSNMVIKQWRFNELNSKNYKLNIVGVKKGIYSLRIRREASIYVEKLIIY